LRRHLEHPTRIVAVWKKYVLKAELKSALTIFPIKTTLRIIEREAREARGAGIVIAGDCDGERIRLA